MDREGLNGCHFFCCGFSFKSSDIRSTSFILPNGFDLCVYFQNNHIIHHLKNGDECMFSLIIVVLVEITITQDKIRNGLFGKFC